MIKQISWASYWTAIALTSIFYYVFICLRYYLSDIRQIFAGKSKSGFRKKVHGNSINGGSEITSSSQEELFPVINQLVQEIKMMLEDALQKKLRKQEILYGFQLLLKKYPAVKDTPFESIVNNYILTECSNCCSIHIEKEEVNMLWLK